MQGGWEPPVPRTGGSDRSRWFERVALIVAGLVAGAVVYAVALPEPQVTVRTSPIGDLAMVKEAPVPWREAQAAFSVTCRHDAVTTLHISIDGLPRDLSYAAMHVPPDGDIEDAAPLRDVVDVRLLHGAGAPADATPIADSSDSPLGSIEIEARFERPPDAAFGLPGLYAHHQLDGASAEMTPVFWLPPRWWACDRA